MHQQFHNLYIHVMNRSFDFLVTFQVQRMQKIGRQYKAAFTRATFLRAIF